MGIPEDYYNRSINVAYMYVVPWLEMRFITNTTVHAIHNICLSKVHKCCFHIIYDAVATIKQLIKPEWIEL